MIAMLDTNAYDAIVDDAALHDRVIRLISEGRLVLRTTHVQEDQLLAIPDVQKRMRVMSLPTQKMPTSAAVWGISRWGEACFGDEAATDQFNAMNHRGRGATADALIGVTASASVEVLVTNDRQLTRRLRVAGDLKVWSNAEFRQWALAQ